MSVNASRLAMQVLSFKDARILIVDDQESNIRLLKALLEGTGYTCFKSVTNPHHVLTAYREFEPDLILLDLRMPDLDGFAIMEALKPLIPEGAFLPILVLTADITPEAKQRALSGGAKDFLTKPLDTIEVVLRIRNLLETRFLHTTLQERNEELEAFGHMVAHDLRSPLITIGGFAQMLVEDHAAALPSEAQEYLQKIVIGTRQMEALLNQLLVFARLTKQSLQTRLVAPSEIARAALADLVPEESFQSAMVRIDTLPSCVADPVLLKQVFVNFLSNALKFTRDREGAVIEVGSCDQATDSMQHTYFVRDNGAGFDMQYADKLFGVFQRLHDKGRYEGTGLGLAIVRRIIQGHGGRVWAEGSPGTGATFYFTLPGSASA
jgi:two-component system sensor histidine kinase/response regulator